MLFDSSVYIDYLRSGNSSVFADRMRASNGNRGQPVYVSSVVLAELYAGATDPKEKKLIGGLEKQFQSIGRLLVPNQSDWSAAGQVLAKIGLNHGFEMVKRSRMTNDCLIAMSARRLGLIVVTHNAKDFRIISELRPFEFEEI
ncbi:MAG: type II toxin-antitoxin system VapC family toxin [Pyrinomonadaceae bacterium]